MSIFVLGVNNIERVLNYENSTLANHKYAIRLIYSCLKIILKNRTGRKSRQFRNYLLFSFILLENRTGYANDERSELDNPVDETQEQILATD